MITVQNEAIKALLLEKGSIVEEARPFIEELEEKQRAITNEEFAKLGVKCEDGLYSGSYDSLFKAFSLETNQTICELMKVQLSDDYEKQESYEARLIAINEKISDIINKEVLPTSGIGEFEIPMTIDLNEDGEIVIETEDLLEKQKDLIRAKLGRTKNDE